MAASRMRPSFSRAWLCRGLVIDLVMEGEERVIEGDETTKRPRHVPMHDTPIHDLKCSTAVKGTQTTKQGAQQHIDIYVKAGGERVMRAVEQRQSKPQQGRICVFMHRVTTRVKTATSARRRSFLVRLDGCLARALTNWFFCRDFACRRLSRQSESTP